VVTITEFLIPDCIGCKWIDPTKRWCCKAFPDGIPEEILHHQADHTGPYPGDNGIWFEPATQE